jgi:hypothetical protein
MRSEGPNRESEGPNREPNRERTAGEMYSRGPNGRGGEAEGRTSARRRAECTKVHKQL